MRSEDDRPSSTLPAHGRQRSKGPILVVALVCILATSWLILGPKLSGQRIEPQQPSLVELISNIRPEHRGMVRIQTFHTPVPSQCAELIERGAEALPLLRMEILREVKIGGLPSRRVNLTTCVCAIPAKESRALLLSLLETTNDSAVLYTIADWCANFPDRQFGAALLRHLRHPEYAVRVATRSALRAITGKDVPSYRPEVAPSEDTSDAAEAWESLWREWESTSREGATDSD